MNVPVGLDSATVPQIASIFLEGLFAAGDQNLIGRLLLGPLVGFENPAKTRLHHVDPQRILQIFAPKIHRLNGAAS